MFDYSVEVTRAVALVTFVIFMCAVYLPQTRMSTTSTSQLFFCNSVVCVRTLLLSLFYVFLLGSLFVVPVHETHTSLTTLGLVCGVYGLLMALYSRYTLRREWKPVTVPGVPNRLVTSGPFARMRHPIYISRILFAIGVFLLTNLWGLFLIPGYAWYLRSRAQTEEQILIQEFPEYANYQSKVASYFLI